MLVYISCLKARRLIKSAHIYRKALNLFIILRIRSIALRGQFAINRIIVLL